MPLIYPVLVATLICVSLLPLSMSSANSGTTRADALCESALAAEKMPDLNRAFAGLWLDRDLPKANARLRAAYDELLGATGEMTPEIADEKFKWQMRTWVCLYYLFADASDRFPGRLEPNTQSRIEELFWNYAFAKSEIARAKIDYVWFIQGSENHDLMDLGNTFLALQAIAKNPRYADRQMRDGRSPQDHVKAWNTYYKLYCEERFKRGLFIEVASPTYGKYLVPELFNLFDFAEDADLRHKAETLLHLTWADWAVEQLDGVRGGGKARCYQGNYSRKGGSDSWRMMGEILLEQGDWANASRYNHPIMGFGFVLSTSRYELPEVVRDLATSPEERGEYAYLTRRPGRMKGLDVLPSVDKHSCWYNFDAKDSRVVRYTWCTPDHIMGCFLTDPTMRAAFQVPTDKPEETASSYAAIHGQNRWQGIIFATGPDRRVFPLCFAAPDKKKPGTSITYVQQVAVQRENVLIVQMNRANPKNKAMRVWFAKGMKDRLVEHKGWLFLEEGESYLALRPLSREDGATTAGFEWETETFLRLEDPYAPIVFVTGRKSRFPGIEGFKASVLAHTVNVGEGVLDYAFADRSDKETHLRMYLNESRSPEIDGDAVDLSPRLTYDGPYVRSATDGETVTIEFRDRVLRLDPDRDSGAEDANAKREAAASVQ